jgi:RNA polymerase sigma-32 factor
MEKRLNAQELSIDTVLPDDSGKTLAYPLTDRGALADDQVARIQERRLLDNEIREFRKTLNGKEADIFDNRIMAEESTTLHKLGEKHHLSRERIRQIEQTVLEKFKRRLEVKNNDQGLA